MENKLAAFFISKFLGLVSVAFLWNYPDKLFYVISLIGLVGSSGNSIGKFFKENPDEKHQVIVVIMYFITLTGVNLFALTQWGFTTTMGINFFIVGTTELSDWLESIFDTSDNTEG